MKNQIRLFRYLKILLVSFIVIILSFVALKGYEYEEYLFNYNEKIKDIVYLLQKEYPNISKEEIIDVLNSESTTNENIFKNYGIDLKKDSIVIKNDYTQKKFMIIYIVFITFSFLIFLIIFLIYEKNKIKEINDITKYIEQLNNKNYDLSIDSISEDELSILKNEIYKTTVMLKETAENSLLDKKNLKKSLEDISHQIKTPLTSILIILDNLIDNPDMDKKTQSEFIRDIKREVTNINFLIQSILKLSKFDANTIDFIKNDCQIKKIIDESIKNVSSLCDLKDIKININGDNNANIYCDFRWQVEAITNIIKNCIDHSENGSQLDITYEQNRVYSAIKIRDYGSGISSKDLPHIFERFYKGENANNDSVGIGLSLSQTIINEDNGYISVNSSNKGSMFIIKYFKQ